MTTYTKQRVTIFLDPSLVKRAKTQAIFEGVSLTALVAKILIKYLPKRTSDKKTRNKTS
jgi:hypothetical protein